MRALRELVRGQPGRRFQDYYRRRHAGPTRKWMVLIASLLAGLGLILAPTPGPGIPLLVLGLALLAAESRAAARLLDRIEKRLRKAFHLSRT